MLFEKEKKGRLINFGGEHLVYKYGKDDIIKFPNFLAQILFNNKKLVEKKKNDFNLANNYFSDFVLPTVYLLKPLIHKPYGLIQPRIKARPLKIKDLKNSRIRENFLKIIEINNKIKEEKNLSFDFLGGWRLIFNWLLPSNYLSNLIITTNNKIIILDVVFLEYEESWSKILLVISRWAERKQQKILKKFIKYARRQSKFR